MCRVMRVAGLLAMLLQVGCSNYVLVESSVATDEIRRPIREIVGTPRYNSVAANVAKVAVRAPEYCSGQSAASNDKQTDRAKSLMGSTCGVQMGVLERQLTESGYDVYSWRAVESMVTAQNKSYLQAARELGAEVLFTVNSLEGVLASSDEHIRRAYFVSSKKGEKGAPWNIGEVHRQPIRGELRPYEASLRDISFGAFLDVTAIDVTTGQAIWFYKSGKYDLENISAPLSFLVAGKKGRWKVVTVNGARPSVVTGSTSVEYDRGSKNRDVGEEQYEKYVRQVVLDFVATFRGKLK